METEKKVYEIHIKFSIDDLDCVDMCTDATVDDRIHKIVFETAISMLDNRNEWGTK